MGAARTACGYDLLVTTAGTAPVGQIASDGLGLEAGTAEATVCIAQNAKIPVDTCKFCTKFPVFGKKVGNDIIEQTTVSVSKVGNQFVVRSPVVALTIWLSRHQLVQMHA